MPDEYDGLVDMSYLQGISNKTFREFFSLDAFGLIDELNALGYKKYYKYVYSGCSETLGEFLSECSDTHSVDYNETRKHTWGDIVGSRIGIPESLNLAVGGNSVMGIVSSLIRQVRMHGAPDHIFVLLPNLDSRIAFIGDPNSLISLRNPTDTISNVSGVGDYETNYSKKPHMVEEILSKRWTTYLNIQSLLSLEALCEASNINLIYSTWSTATHKVLTAANHIATVDGDPLPFKNYVPSDYRKSAGDIGCMIAANSIDKGCHSNDTNHPRWGIGRGGHHMGAHAHLHIADIFAQELKNRGIPLSL